MDQGAPAESVAGARRDAVPDSLADRVAAVRAARERLGRDLDQLTVEVRAQMGSTMEKAAWKAAAAAAGIGAGLAMRQLLAILWRKARHSDPPDNPAAPGTGWGEAVAWTLAMASGMAVAKLVAIRGAAEGWRLALGTPPPGLGPGAAAGRARRR